jgi:hypothetical protein
MPRGARKLRNQALFREVNDRIAALSTEMDGAESEAGFVCECRQLGCAELIQVPIEVSGS